MKVILASQSPRRAALMDLARIDFEVMPSEYEEKIKSGMNIEEQAKELAFGKALDEATSKDERITEVLSTKGSL